VVRERQIADLVEVDVLGTGVYGVPDVGEPLTGEVDLAAVCQMPAVRKLHGQHGVAMLHERGVRGQVGRGAGVRLDVRVFCAEQLLGPGDRELLGTVHLDAAAVIARPRVALGVLVGQRRTERGQHGRRGEVLAGDELQAAALPVEFGQDHRGDLRIRTLERAPVRSPEGVHARSSTGEAGPISEHIAYLGPAAGTV
jgi:hypothetical protein